MTSYLIDTNVISEVRKRKPHGGVLAWLESLEVGRGFFSAVTFGEIEAALSELHQHLNRRLNAQRNGLPTSVADKPAVLNHCFPSGSQLRELDAESWG